MIIINFHFLIQPSSSVVICPGCVHNKKAMVVCQSQPEFYLNNQVSHIEKLNTKMDKLDKKKNDQLIPIGFLYTQYPSQTSPDDIWPGYKWSDITSQYAGLFFRAGGGGSLPFGQTQQANQTWISDIKAEGSVDDNNYHKHCIMYMLMYQHKIDEDLLSIHNLYIFPYFSIFFHIFPYFHGSF